MYISPIILLVCGPHVPAVIRLNIVFYFHLCESLISLVFYAYQIPYGFYLFLGQMVDEFMAVRSLPHMFD